MCAIPQLVSAPLNPIPIAEHFRRSHPQCKYARQLNNKRERAHTQLTLTEIN